MSHREEALGEDPGHAGETMSLGLAWERLGSPPGRAGGSVWGEGSLGISAQTAVSMRPGRWISGWKDGWMDGWMDVISSHNEVRANDKDDKMDKKLQRPQYETKRK
ncbi:hypothetical protein L3Q82_007522 [Scortum barcoo]|uniref:Uncharacterized protein n=1 Tax=Scortum barcoo TaxID=214431 RepID=A0ACB8WNE5_9TELE|nr:hypothetical protein L3Q82_007522 [Scortum barcoo]